jgi:hypothetical protein
MSKTLKQNIRAFPQASKAPIEMFPYFNFGMKHAILQPTLDIAMNILFGVEFRSIRRQILPAANQVVLPLHHTLLRLGNARLQISGQDRSLQMGIELLMEWNAEFRAE